MDTHFTSLLLPVNWRNISLTARHGVNDAYLTAYAYNADVTVLVTVLPYGLQC